MTRQRYNKTESLNRILRLLEGKPTPTDVPGTVTGEMLSEEKALSDIAELIANSLPNETFVNPDVVQNDFATYGGLYTWTGTVALTGITANWTKITGTFQNSMVNGPTAEITCQPTQDRIFLNGHGMFFIQWQMSYIGSSAITYKVEPYCFVGMPQASAESTPYSSGTVTSMGGGGLVYSSGTSQPVALYILPSVTGAWIKPTVVQISVRKVRNTP